MDSKRRGGTRTHFETLDYMGRPAPVCGLAIVQPRLTRHPPDVDCLDCQKAAVFVRASELREAGMYSAAFVL